MQTIKKLFEYDVWAINRILDALKDNENKAALKTLGHLLMAEKIWLLRLQGVNTAQVNVSPELSLAECDTLANEMREAYSAFLDSRRGAQLDDKLTYKNYAGTEFQTPIREILTHVALHSQYHRGQIAAAIRAANVQPANTDFINFVRETSD